MGYAKENHNMPDLDLTDLGLRPAQDSSDLTDLGLRPAQDSSDLTDLGLHPAQAPDLSDLGLSLANPDDIKVKQQKDPYSLTDSEWGKLRQADQNAGPLEQAGEAVKGGWGAVKHLAGLVPQAVHEQDTARGRAVQTLMDRPTLAGAVEAGTGYLGDQAATYLEALGQAGALVPQTVQRGLDYLKRAEVNPVRAALKTMPMATGNDLADLVAPETAGQAQDLTAQYKANYLRDYERSKLGTAAPAELLQGFTPQPATAEGTSLALSLPAWEAGAEALGLRAAAKASQSMVNESLSRLPKATEGAVPPAISSIPPVIPGTAVAAAQEEAGSRLLHNTGAVATSLGSGLSKIGGAPGALLEKLAGVFVGPEDAAAVAGKAEAAGFGAFPLIRKILLLKGAGTTIKTAGDLFQQLGQDDSIYGRLWALSRNPQAPPWMRRVAGMPITRAAANVGDVAGHLVKGAAEGAMTGATFSAATGATPEETGSNVATMGMFGLGGKALSLPYVRQMKLAQPTRAGVLNMMDRNLRGGATPDTLAKVGDWPFVNALALETLQPDWRVQFLDEPMYNTVAAGEGKGTPGVTDWGRKTIFINADELSRRPAATILHEIFHPMWMAETANRPGLRAAMDALMAKHGLTINQAKQGYAERFLSNSPDYNEKMMTDWIAQQDAQGAPGSQPGDWIYSEMLCDGSTRQLWGKNAVEVAAGLRGGAGAPVEHRPTTVFEGFEPVLDDPAMGKLVRGLLERQKNFRPGIDAPATQEVKLSEEDIGGVKLPETGQTFQDYFARTGSGRVELKSAAQQRKGERNRQTIMNGIFPVNVKALPLHDMGDQMALRERSSGGVERRGRKLGDAFYQNPNIGESMKLTASVLEHMMGLSDEDFSAWYNKTNKNGISTVEDLIAEYKWKFKPDEFFIDKHGHLLVRGKDFGTLEDRILPDLASKHGDYSLDLWAGNVPHAIADAKIYTRNLEAGRPGAEGIGDKKRNVLNAAIFGRNVGEEGANPLRAGVKSKKDAGIIRSYRIDRIETIERSKSEHGQAPWNAGKLNYTPSTDPRAVRAAAVQDDQGHIFEGEHHLAAYQAATAAGVKPEDLGKMHEGFVTNTPQEFLDREQGFQRANELSQLKQDAPVYGAPTAPQLVSEAVKPGPAAKPEVAKLGISKDKNNFGDPLGTQYRATPEDWAKWQDLQGRLKAMVASGNFDAYPPMGKENETLKNKYGGNPPMPPTPGEQQFSPPAETPGERKQWAYTALRAAQDGRSEFYIHHTNNRLSEALKEAADTITRGYAPQEFNEFSGAVKDSIRRLLQIAHKQGLISYGRAYYPDLAGGVSREDRPNPNGQINPEDLLSSGGKIQENATTNEEGEPTDSADWWKNGEQSPPMQFSPSAQTKAGKALEKEGFRFDDSAQDGHPYDSILVYHGKQLAGEIHYFKLDPQTAMLDSVEVQPAFRSGGLGTALYSELAARLQRQGVTALLGDVQSALPFGIRNKVFGGFRSITLSEVPSEAAHEYLSEANLSGQLVMSRIDPEKQFSPKADRETEAALAKTHAVFRNPDGTLKRLYHGSVRASELAASGKFKIPTMTAGDTPFNQAMDNAYNRLEELSKPYIRGQRTQPKSADVRAEWRRAVVEHGKLIDMDSEAQRNYNDAHKVDTHGSSYSQFYGPVLYFTDNPAYASGYSLGYPGRYNPELLEGAGVVPVYIDAKNPLLLQKTYVGKEIPASLNVPQNIARKGLTGEQLFDLLSQRHNPKLDVAAWRKWTQTAEKEGFATSRPPEPNAFNTIDDLKHAGFDSLNGHETLKMGKKTGYNMSAVFDPKQVTGAFGGTERKAADAQQYSPAATPAGKKLETQGYHFVQDDFGPGTGLLSLRLRTKFGRSVGIIEVTEDGKGGAHVDLVDVANNFQGKGFGEVLYREALTELQKRGVTTLSGSIVHPAPEKIRNKLLGAPTSREEAGVTRLGGQAWNVTHQIPVDKQFSPSVLTDATAAVKPDQVPELDRDQIQGGHVSVPVRSYHEAASEGNPWVRRSADPTRSAEPTNENRLLMVQFSSDLLNPPSKDIASGYYDKLYSGARPGYARLGDFWEIPQWMGFVAHSFGDADVYVVRDMGQAKQFLNEAGYGRVAFSALDINTARIKELAASYPGKVDVGGYVEEGTFKDSPNVTWHPSVEALAKAAGVPFQDGVDYRHFAGSDVIP